MLYYHLSHASSALFLVKHLQQCFNICVVQGKLFSLMLACWLMLFYNSVPPLVVPVNSHVIGVEGEEAVLTFNVINAIPPVTIDNVRWLSNREGNITDITNNTMVDNNTLTFEINSTTQMYSLTISNIQPNYTSRLILRVSNPAGVDSNYIDFIVEGSYCYAQGFTHICVY